MNHAPHTLGRMVPRFSNPRLRNNLNLLFDCAKQRMTGFIFHFDADSIPVFQEGRHRFARCQGFNNTGFQNAGITDPTVCNRFSRTAIELVGHCA